MSGSRAVIDLAALEFVVDRKLLIEMHGDARARLHVDGGEGLPVQLVHPLPDVADAAGEDAVEGRVAVGSGRPEAGAVAAEDGTGVVLVGVQELGDAGPGCRE